MIYTENTNYTNSLIPEIFEKIKNRLLSNIDTLTDVRIWNEQVDFQAENLPFKAPVVFIEFADNQEVETISDEIDSITSEIIIKVVLENYTQDKLEVYNYRSLVNSYLNKWNDWAGNELTRTSQKVLLFDNLIVAETTYLTYWYEYSNPNTPVTIGGSNGLSWGLSVEMRMDSNFDGIYGTGGFALVPNTYIPSNPDTEEETPIPEQELPVWTNTPKLPKNTGWVDLDI